MEKGQLDTMEAISRILDNASRVPSASQTLDAIVTPFSAPRKPTISIHDYARMLKWSLRSNDECYISCLVYIERILERNAGFVLCHANVHRLLLTAMVVAVKFHDDLHSGNAFYAKMGGVSTSELAKLEVCFLTMLGWRAHVSQDEYDRYVQRLTTNDASLCMPRQAVEPVENRPAQEAHLRSALLVVTLVKEETEQVASHSQEVLAAKEETLQCHGPSQEVSAAKEQTLQWQLTGKCHRRSRKRSVSSVTHLNLRRTRICLAARRYVESGCRDLSLTVLQHTPA